MAVIFENDWFRVDWDGSSERVVPKTPFVRVWTAAEYEASRAVLDDEGQEQIDDCWFWYQHITEHSSSGTR